MITRRTTAAVLLALCAGTANAQTGSADAQKALQSEVNKVRRIGQSASASGTSAAAPDEGEVLYVYSLEAYDSGVGRKKGLGAAAGDYLRQNGLSGSCVDVDDANDELRLLLRETLPADAKEKLGAAFCAPPSCVLHVKLEAQRPLKVLHLAAMYRKPVNGAIDMHSGVEKEFPITAADLSVFADHCRSMSGGYYSSVTEPEALEMLKRLGVDFTQADFYYLSLPLNGKRYHESFWDLGKNADPSRAKLIRIR